MGISKGEEAREGKGGKGRERRCKEEWEGKEEWDEKERKGRKESA